MESKPLNRSLHAARRPSRMSFTPSFPTSKKSCGTTPNTSGGSNCDDPKVSNFFHYFSHKFHTLGLKKLIATCYKNVDPDFSKHEGKRGLRLIYNGELTPGGRVPSLSKLDMLPSKPMATSAAMSASNFSSRRTSSSPIRRLARSAFLIR